MARQLWPCCSRQQLRRSVPLWQIHKEGVRGVERTPGTPGMPERGEAAFSRYRARRRRGVGVRSIFNIIFHSFHNLVIFNPGRRLLLSLAVRKFLKFSDGALFGALRQPLREGARPRGQCTRKGFVDLE